MNEKAFLEGNLASHGEIKVPRHLGSQGQILKAAQFVCRLALVRLTSDVSPEMFRTSMQMLNDLNKLTKAQPAKANKENEAEDLRIMGDVEKSLGLITGSKA